MEYLKIQLTLTLLYQDIKIAIVGNLIVVSIVFDYCAKFANPIAMQRRVLFSRSINDFIEKD